MSLIMPKRGLEAANRNMRRRLEVAAPFGAVRHGNHARRDAWRRHLARLAPAPAWRGRRQRCRVAYPQSCADRAAFGFEPAFSLSATTPEKSILRKPASWPFACRTVNLPIPALCIDNKSGQSRNMRECRRCENAGLGSARAACSWQLKGRLHRIWQKAYSWAAQNYGWNPQIVQSADSGMGPALAMRCPASP